MIAETQNQQPSVNVYPNAGNNGGFGDLFGGSGGGIILWLILFFFMIMFMGWGNNNGNASGNGYGNAPYMPYPVYMPGYGGGNGGNSYAVDAVRQGFDQAAVLNGIGELGSTLQQGFNNAEVSRCNQQANLLAAIQGQQAALQTCCCENRAGIADVKYALATEACADRNAVKDALQELTAQNNANMNAMAMMFNNGVQSLKDEFCQSRIEAKDARIAELERQLTFAQTSDLVNNSRNAILANNDMQTTALEQYLDPTPRPAYIVQNPRGCNCNQGYGCYNRCCGQ